jgi:hypothetical protein
MGFKGFALRPNDSNVRGDNPGVTSVEAGGFGIKNY